MIIRYIFILLIFFVVPNLSAVTPKSYFNNDTTIIIEYNIADPYYSKWIMTGKTGIKFNIIFDCVVSTVRTCTYKLPFANRKDLYGIGAKQCTTTNGVEDNCSSTLDPKDFPTPWVFPEFRPPTEGGPAIIQGQFLVLNGYSFELIDGSYYVFDSFPPSFDPTNITIQDVGKGCGTRTFLWPNSKTLDFKYADPYITSAVVGENTISLNGINFCSVNYSSHISVITSDDSLAIKGPLEWDNINSTIRFNKVEPDYASTVYFSINAWGSISNKYPIKFPPFITSINSISANKGGTVTIIGKRLLAKEVDAHPSVKIGTTDCTITGQTTNQITCTLPSTTSTSTLDLKITLSIGGLDNDVNSKVQTFSYGIPLLKTHSFSGNVLILYGENLGTSATTQILIEGVVQSFKGTVDPNESSISFSIPVGYKKSNISVTTANGKTSNPLIIDIEFNIDAKEKPITSGQDIIIQFNNILDKNNFSTPLISILPQQLTGTPTNITGIKGHNLYGNYTFTIPSGCGKKEIFAHMGDQQTNSFFYYQSPSLVSCEINQDDNYIICNGSNFAQLSDDNDIEVLFSNQLIVPTSIDNHKSFKILLEPNFTSGNISIRVCGLDSINNYFINLESEITNYQTLISEPQQFKSTGGDILITGHFFSKNNGPTFLKCDQQQFNCSYINSNEYSCPISLAGPYDKTCEFTFQNQTKDSIKIKYLSPIIESVTGNTSIKGGLVTIKGSEFYNFTTIITIGNLNCQNVIFIDSNTLTCELEENTSVVSYDELLQVNIIIQITNNDNNDTSTDNNNNNKSSSYLIFKYTRDNSNSNESSDQGDKKKNKLKWMVPAIVVPIVCFIALIFIGPELFRRFYTYPPPKPTVPQPEPGFIRRPYNPPNPNGDQYNSSPSVPLPNFNDGAEENPLQLSFVPIQP